MRLYLDTEFNGHGGELISLALVSEGGDEFYAVLPLPGEVDPWVARNVIPKLNSPPISAAKFRIILHNWLSPRFKSDNPTIICDWPADAMHFCASLAGQDFESSLDFPCKIIILQTPPGQPVSLVPHYALEDARALRHWHLNHCI